MIYFGVKTDHVFFQEFIIHTPHQDAQKIYIGNAIQGQMGAVFAQLYIDGECKGISHANQIIVQTALLN